MKRFGLLLLLFAGSALAAPSNILNVSYDVTREFYQQFNLAFSSAYEKGKWCGCHGRAFQRGSTKQARAVIDGLQADVVTMNQETDINAIAKAGLISGQLEVSLAEQCRAVHFHDCLPRPQGKSRRGSAIGAIWSSRAFPSSCRIRRPPATDATVTLPPGPMREVAPRRKRCPPGNSSSTSSRTCRS